jgi:predicted enzyme related to lactoylglutathione lyase
MIGGMDCTLRHVAINADDLLASARFYGLVFGWRFEPYRQPGFMRTTAGGLIVALQARRPVGGIDVTGFEPTVAVPDVAAAATDARAAGGRVLMEPTTIPGVGALAWLADPGGNVVGAMTYEA